MDPTQLITTHPSRAQLQNAQRVVIKCGTAILSSEEGHPSLTRLSNIVESVVELSRKGVEVVLVASGAVGCGRQVLHRANLMKASFASQLLEQGQGGREEDSEERDKLNAAAAATGQLALMSLFDTLFTALNVQCSQLLFVSADFNDPLKVNKMSQSIESLIGLGIIPIINENDAVSAVDPSDPHPESFSDNDTLAALVARQLGADLLLILTDVDAVYNRPPTEAGAERIRTLDAGRASALTFGERSARGRGGMESKIKAALRAVQRPKTSSLSSAEPSLNTAPQSAVITHDPLGQAVEAVVIVNGHEPRAPIRALLGEDMGTLVVSDASEWDAEAQAGADSSDALPLRAQVQHTREAKQALVTLPPEERQAILMAIADALEERQGEILEANRLDLEAARAQELDPPLMKRLGLSEDKLKTLAQGIRDIARVEEPIGRAISALEVSPELKLERVTAPLGVLLVIFESRPDSLPQIAALSLRSGNGLILKGGREAKRSNHCLHAIITETVERVTEGRVSRDVISLVTTRAEISQLLALDDLIDLVVPRGGNALVRHVQESTKIPVLGHADGVCHVYVDELADLDKATRVVVDAKINYPAACNAMETLLIHRAHIESGAADRLLRELRRAGVSVLGGPKAIEEGLISQAHAAVPLDPEESADPLHVEYGDLICACEIVEGLDEAIAHCNEHGSGHTEAIISEDEARIERFLREVDSACVFANASTRFADGFRLGLGAEVGISTSRIHARGPVGIEGLLTSKWLLRSTRSSGHTVGEFSSEGGPQYTHRPLP